MYLCCVFLAGDPFTGSYASQKIKNLNIFSRLLNCINLDDNAESWCMPDAAIPEISPTLSFLTTSYPTGRDGNGGGCDDVGAAGGGGG